MNQIFNYTKDYTFLSVKDSYNYVFTTLPVNYINNQFLEALQNFIVSLFQTVASLMHILFFLSLYLSKLLILVFPHAVQLSNIIYKFHKTQLSTSDLIIEFVSIVLILTCFIFRSRIQKLWLHIIQSISNKSKAAAKAAPHILYFGSAITFAIIGKKFLLPFTNSTVMPIITLVIPLLTTIRSIYNKNELSLIKTSEIMLLWIILAIYHGIVTCLSYIPFSSKILAILPYIKELVLIILIWTQISTLFSKLLFDTIIMNILLKISKFVPASDMNENTTTQANTITSILKMLNLINDQQLSFLKALFQDSVATIIAIGFLFTPTFISNFGIVIISLFLPAIRTTTVTVSILSIEKISKNKYDKKNNIEKPNDLSLTKDYMQFQWIRYWICLSILWLLRIYIFKLWPSVMILLVLWLQHSYFLGMIYNKILKARSFIYYIIIIIVINILYITYLQLGATYILNFISESFQIAIERNLKVQKEYNNKTNFDNIDIIKDNENDIKNNFEVENILVDSSDITTIIPSTPKRKSNQKNSNNMSNTGIIADYKTNSESQNKQKDEKKNI